MGLPADALIDNTGTIVAIKYGRHASDQWMVEELLALASETVNWPPPLPQDPHTAHEHTSTRVCEGRTCTGMTRHTGSSNSHRVFEQL